MKQARNYLYLLPASIIMAVMLGFPVVYNIGMSFYEWTLQDSEKKFAGFTNYVEIMADNKLLSIIIITVIWTVLGILLQMILGIGLALFIEELTKGKKVMRTILLIPWIIPGVISALMWKWMLQADVGIINYILMELNITDQNILFLSDVNITLFVLILINVWKATPFWFLMITASLQNKPMDQIEAAIMDGAKYRHILTHVILPYLSPVIASTGVLTTIWTLNYFDLIWVTTKGGPMDSTSTLPVYTYRLAFEFNDLGKSASMAVISLLIVSIVCIPYVRKMFKDMKEEGMM